MLNWAGFGFKCASADFKLGQDLMNIGVIALQGASQQAQAAGSMMSSISKEASYRAQAKSYRTAADDALKEAGRVQEQGRQARESVLVKLGQAKGQIISGAAGSGIDVTSRTVNKTVKDTIKSAFNDVSALAENERSAAQSKINERTSMQINAIWADSNANQESINQKLISNQMSLIGESTKMQQVAGALSAVSNWCTGMAGAGSSLMGGW